MVRAAEERGIEGELIVQADAAIAAYARLIDVMGGSQAQLLEKLAGESQRAPRSEPHTAAVGVAREASSSVFAAARQVTRRELQTQIAIFAYQPCASDPDRMDCATVLGMIGLRRDEGCLPVVPMQTYNFGDARRDPADLVPRPIRAGRWPEPVALLEEFCTRPLPTFVAKRYGGRVPLLIEESDSSAPADVVIGARFVGVPSFLLDPPHAQYCSLVSEGPARWLVLQVHMHRSLAQSCVASVDAYSISQRGRVGDPLRSSQGFACVDRPEDRWFDRLPDRPRMEYLGLGLDRVGHPSYERIAQLTETLFTLQSWDPGGFVGYRTAVQDPVWGVQYLMSFTSGEDSPEEQPPKPH